MARTRAFTLVELAAISLILAFAVALFMPAMGTHCHSAPQMQNNTQVRGIHQALVMYAQGNNDHFPGLNPDGSDAHLAVEERFQILLDGNYFTGDYLVSPAEVKTAWTTGQVTSANYSYAMLQISAADGRRAEWSQTLNTQAVALSDRLVGTAAAPLSIFARSVQNVPRRVTNLRSLSCWWDGCYSHSGYSGPGWRGSVAYNDNHVVFENTHILETRYGGGPLNRADDLFRAAGGDDALMVHSGN